MPSALNFKPVSVVPGLRFIVRSESQLIENPLSRKQVTPVPIDDDHTLSVGWFVDGLPGDKPFERVVGLAVGSYAIVVTTANVVPALLVWDPRRLAAGAR